MKVKAEVAMARDECGKESKACISKERPYVSRNGMKFHPAGDEKVLKNSEQSNLFIRRK